MKINDIVSRKSYDNDIWFKIIDIKDDKVILEGINFRLIADAPISDLEMVHISGFNEDINSNSTNLFKKWYTNQFNIYSDDVNISNNNSSSIDKSYKKFGKILHIDGDKFYLNECLRKYNKLGIAAIGVSIEESKQPDKILELLEYHKPNILVITGHDSIMRGKCNLDNIDCYKNSKYYIESVKIAREYNRNYDDLVIFAGGCKSYYEGLMNAGANFAASPGRILLHVTDPVIVACTIAKTSVREYLDIESIVRDTSTGLNGIGGFETRGQCREYKPIF